MDLKAVGQRIKAAREAKNLTQEELAALVNLSTTHVSVIERGLKVTKLDTFVAIANALDKERTEKNFKCSQSFCRLIELTAKLKGIKLFFFLWIHL